MAIHRAYISAGSNIGNKLRNCRSGIAALTEPGTSFVKETSGYYLTEPVDFLDQDWFINCVVKIETRLDPYQLLDELRSIETRAGRAGDRVKFGPRILDLDIIFYDDMVENSTRLVVPHPRMHKRRFVLKPICDIDPKLVHPVLKKDMQYLLDNLDDGGQEILRYK